MPFTIDVDPALDFKGRARPSPAIELRVRLTWKAPDKLTSCIFHSMWPEASLRVGTSCETIDAHVSEMGSVAVSRDGHFRVKIRLETPHDLLERVEDARKDAPAVQLSLTPGLAVIPVQGLNWLRPESVDLGPHTISIPRDEWRRILSEVGFRDVLVFEFGAHELVATDPHLRAALDELSKARRAYDDNHTEAVALHAFLALEALASRDPSTRPVAERIAGAYFAGDHEEVRARVQKALIGILPSYHVGRHMVGARDAPRVQVSRSHAKWILGTAQLVIGWCATAQSASAPANA